MKHSGVVISLAVLLSVPAWGREGAPPAVQKYADSVMGDLKKMVGQDPNLLKDMGVTKPEELNALKPNYDKAFVMKKVEPAKLEGAKHLSDAITSTGIHYVPLCDANRCPIMASFRDGGPNQAPEFESIGQPNLTHQIMETGSQLRAGGGFSAEGLEVVQYPEARANFFLGTKSNGEEVLIPQSPEEGKLLAAALNRPPSETDGAGRPRFSLNDMRLIAKTTREEAELNDNAPTTGLSDESEFDHTKPANTAGLPTGSDPGSDDYRPGAPAVQTEPLSAQNTTGAAPLEAASREPLGVSETPAPERASRAPQMAIALLSLLMGGYLVRRRSLYLKGV